jgi:4-diphosphocytidyl-2-C-methyl-D-erythritol kinase
MVDPEPEPREVRKQARAKINLFLRVLGLREDEYHDLETLIVPVSLADEVLCREAKSGLSLRVELPGGAGSSSEPVSEGPDNLVVVAALALAEARPAGLGAEIVLTKHIPVAAGLGGGSADAAATLLALNELWSCGLDGEALQGFGSLVGSDVPAMLAGRPVLARGRGVKLETVAAPSMWWAIVPFDFPVRTPDAYRWWDEDGADALTGPDPATVIEASASGDVEALASLMFNDLEAPVFRRHPEVGQAKRRLLDAGAIGALMCGSGPTVAGLVPDEKAARALAEAVPGAVVASSLG